MTAPEPKPGSVTAAFQEERERVAYEATMNLFSAQERTVGNYRTRATGIFATAAFIVSFSSSVGLVGNDSGKGTVFPFWAAITLLSVVVVQGVLVMLVLWPRVLSYGHEITGLIHPRVEDAQRRPIDTKLVEDLLADLGKNREQIVRISRLYQGATFLLLVEVAVILAAVAVTR
ncbi:hypothetical protein AB0B13_21440 [Streptomyces sp. NPDC042898]|uniref:hypothetical protein n=1 Tax=Streptomyces sp. NPDC042898 TaxID=3154334 RepID=UPI0033F7D6DE